MTIKKYLLIMLLMVVYNSMIAQFTPEAPADRVDRPTKTNQTNRDFMYKGKPISPEMLMPFFPLPQDSSSQSLVDLDHGLLYVVQPDTVWSNSLKWLSPKQAQRGYTCNTDFGFVSYIVLGSLAPDRFAILACMNRGGGSDLAQYYTFVVDIRGNKLVKTCGLKTPNLKESPVTIKGNKIVYRDKPYVIPAEKK